MSLLAWFRGLFGKPTQKRQNIKKRRIYVKMNNLPPRGVLNEKQAREMVSMWPHLTDKQIARKLNAMEYLTTRGRRWTIHAVSYWKQTDEQLKAKRRQKLKYWHTIGKKKNKQPQTVIFRNADLRPRQNGVN